MTPEAAKLAIGRALARIAPEADLAALDPGADLRESLDIDSMDFLNFVVALHAETAVEVPEADYPRLATLAGCVAYLVAAGARQGA